MAPLPFRRIFRLPLRRPELTDAHIDEEIDLHLALRAEVLQRRGLSRVAATAEAERRFGALGEARPLLRAAARIRDRRLTMSERWETWTYDFRHAVRQLRLTPWQTGAIVAMFALGIGANAVMFGTVRQLLLTSPPALEAPERWYTLSALLRVEKREFALPNFSYPDYRDVRQRLAGSAEIVAQGMSSVASLGRGTAAQQIKVMPVGGTYFPAMGVRPRIGRLLTEADEAQGASVVVLGERLWRSTFGADSGIIGRTIVIDSTTVTVVGVAPAGFGGTFRQATDLWMPLVVPAWARDSRDASWLQLSAKLAPGISPEQATAQTTAALRDARRAASGTDELVPLFESVLPWRAAHLSTTARIATLLAGIALLILLMACANVANLLLARALQRQRDIALRLALGISRARLVGQLLGEGLLLALAGGLASLALIPWGSRLVQQAMSNEFPWADAPLDAATFRFMLAAVLGIGGLTVAAPLVYGVPKHLARSLASGGRGDPRRTRVRRTLLLAQITLSTLLLCGATAFLLSLRRAVELPVGVDGRRVLVIHTYLTTAGLSPERADLLYDQLAARARAVPGVAQAGLVDGMPFDVPIAATVRLPGERALKRPQGGSWASGVTPGYFALVGTPILQGRALVEADQSGERVVVISETLARLLAPAGDAIGRCIDVDGYLQDRAAPCARVVGIAADVFSNGLLARRAVAQAYLPLSPPIPHLLSQRALIVRTSTDPTTVIAALRRALQETAPDLPALRIEPMATRITLELRSLALGATILSAFGALALVLSAMGVFSVVAYTVSQRMHEMGVRLALGAHGRDLTRLILGEGTRLALLGAVLGTVGAFLLRRWITPLLFQTSSAEPRILGLAAGAMIITAIAAALIPARRAAAADPNAVLRAD